VPNEGAPQALAVQNGLEAPNAIDENVISFTQHNFYNNDFDSSDDSSEYSSETSSSDDENYMQNVPIFPEMNDPDNKHYNAYQKY